MTSAVGLITGSAQAEAFLQDNRADLTYYSLFSTADKFKKEIHLND
jgi:hypothetical protein